MPHDTTDDEARRLSTLAERSAALSTALKEPKLIGRDSRQRLMEHLATAHGLTGEALAQLQNFHTSPATGRHGARDTALCLGRVVDYTARTSAHLAVAVTSSYDNGFRDAQDITTALREAAGYLDRFVSAYHAIARWFRREAPLTTPAPATATAPSAPQQSRAACR